MDAYIPASRLTIYENAETKLLRFCKNIPDGQLAPMKTIAKSIGVSERTIRDLRNKEKFIPFFAIVNYERKRIVCAGHPKTIAKIRNE